MPLLPATGEISYNGVQFGSETETLSVNIKPIPDPSGRTIASNLYTFRIKTLVAVQASTGDTSTDNALESMRTRLLVYGGEFKYHSKGLGDIDINVGGDLNDVEWGPKVEELDWKPLGGNLASWITLQISFKTLDCSNPIFRFGIMEFNYKVEFEQGHDRLTRRTYTGHLKIPQTRQAAGNRQLTDTADAYYERIVPPIPVGWRRENERRSLDEAKTRLDFSFADVMLKAPLEVGVVDMDWDHEQSNSPPFQMNVKEGRINAWYEIALDYPLALAQLHFENLWRSRLVALVFAGNMIIPQTYRSKENQQKRIVDFSLNYRLIRFTNLLPILGQQGFYRSSTTANHALWATSMETAMRPRGYTQDEITPDQDVIIDLCLNSEVTLAPEQGNIGISPPGTFLEPYLPVCPGEENSWVWWACWIEESHDSGIVAHKPLPSKPPPAPKPYVPGGPGFVPPGGTKPGGDPSVTNDMKDDPATTPQRRTSPTVHIWLVGYAIRVCYPIPEPILISIGDSDAIPDNREEREWFRIRTLGNTGVPIFVAMWRRRYVLVQQTDADITAPQGPLVPNEDVTPGDDDELLNIL